MFSRIVLIFIAAFSAMSVFAEPVLFDTNWAFTNGPEFPGASGSYQPDGKMLCNGRPTGVLDADFSHGGNYVGIRRWISESVFVRLSCELMSDTTMMGVFVSDASQQWHYLELPLSGDAGVWQKLEINFADPDFKSTAHGGGKNDGKVYLPLRDLMFRVSPRGELKKFSVRFGNLQVKKATAKSDSANSASRIKPDAPGGLFTNSEALCFKYGSKQPGLRYLIRDWRGNVVIEGAWPADGAQPLCVERIPQGYYTLSLSAGKTTLPGGASFSVLSPLDSSSVNQDCPYGLDVAAVFIPSVDGLGSRTDGYRFFASLAQRAGIKMIRERLNWETTEKTRGIFELQDFTAYHDILREYGIKTCVTNHTAPLWAKKNDKAKLPDNPLAVYNFMKKMSETYKSQTVWEFWNEQDLIFFTSEPAWQFATMMKAAYLGARAGAPGNPVLPGAFCNPVDSGYNKVVMENGVADYFDIFNRHIYEPLCHYPRYIRETRDFLRRYGVEDKPVWVTENGTRAEGPGKGGKDSAREHSPEQEMLQAEFVVKSQLILQSLGVAKNFTFVLPPYNEGDGAKIWGLVRFDYSAKPGLTALAVLTRQLGAAQYQGEINLGRGLCGLLFKQPDNSQSVVFWSKSELDNDDYQPFGILPTQLYKKGFNLSAVAAATVVDMLGISQSVMPKNGKIQLESIRFPAYVNNLHGLKASRPAIAPRTVATGKDGIEKSIVLQLLYEENDGFEVNAFSRDNLIVKRSVQKPRLKLAVWNLSDKPQRGRLNSLPPNVAGFPAEMDIPPFESRELEFALPQSASSLNSVLAVNGIFNGKQISPLCVPITRRDLLVPAGARQLTNAGKPDCWRKNSSGEMTVSRGDAVGEVRFNSKFSPGVDRWMYPELMLALPGESLKDAIAIEFEIKSEQTAHTSVVMFIDDKGSGPCVSYEVIPGKWTKCSVDIPSGGDLARMIRIGMNPDTLNASYQLRNVAIRYGKFTGQR